MNIEKLLRSSADPDKVGISVKAILVGFLPMFFMALSFLGVEFPEALVNDLTAAITGVVVAGLTFISAIMFAFGIGRKIYIGIFKR